MEGRDLVVVLIRDDDGLRGVVVVDGAHVLLADAPAFHVEAAIQRTILASVAMISGSPPSCLRLAGRMLPAQPPNSLPGGHQEGYVQDVKPDRAGSVAKRPGKVVMVSKRPEEPQIRTDMVGGDRCRSRFQGEQLGGVAGWLTMSGARRCHSGVIAAVSGNRFRGDASLAAFWAAGGAVQLRMASTVSSHSASAGTKARRAMTCQFVGQGSGQCGAKPDRCRLFVHHHRQTIVVWRRF